MRKRRRSSPGIQSLRRADAILQVVAKAPEASASLSEIASDTDLNKSTANSLFYTLLSLDYLAQDPRTRRYRLGTRVFELGRTAELQFDIVERCRLVMIRLATVSRESVSLAVPSHLYAVLVQTIESSYAVRGSGNRGRHLPYHCSAAGKAMFANFHRDHRFANYETNPPVRLTLHTIVDRKAIERDLAETRERGFSITLEEEEVGARAVGAPIFGSFGDVIAALAVWGPVSRFPHETLHSYGRLVQSECASLSAAIAQDSAV